MNVFHTVTNILLSKRMRGKMEPEFWLELFLEWLVIFFRVPLAFFFFAVFVFNIYFFVMLICYDVSCQIYLHYCSPNLQQ